MQRRTFESPMDWEYQGTGPVDATSPFTQLARNPTQNIFSPSKQQQNPFSNPPPLSTPTKPAAPSFFTPRIPGSQTAAPFRNPAFTTPRKPLDDLALSEASGAESSPALTEPSDCPADTPELDRMADLNMATITPSRIDKVLRYNKSGQSRRHAPGRGEIPRARDHSAVDHMRRRKRRNQSRDARQLGWDSDASSDDGYGPRPHPPQAKGWLAAVADSPQKAHNYIRVTLNAVLALSVVFLGWKVYAAVHADIATANRAAQAARLNGIAECTRQYQENQCVRNLPALRELCETWRNCMTDDPEAIFMVRNTIKELASILNEFAGQLHLKAWGFFFLGILVLIFYNLMAAQRIESPKPAPHMGPYGAAPPWAPHMGAPADFNPWMHVQTPRRRHRLEMDEASETETDDGQVFSRAIMPPQTPSRRSPRKERERSPVKFGRSPTKLYN